MKRFKLFFALMLSLALIVTSMTTVAFAAGEESQEGTVPEVVSEAEEPVIVNNPEAPVDLSINGTIDSSLKAKGFTKSILIAGLDAGNRADVILVYCFNEITKEGRLFSVSRETYMQLNNEKSYTIDGKVRDFCKCNMASEFGGMGVLARELNRHLDLNIRQYIGITWQGVADLADAMGGIEGNITSGEMLKGINAGVGNKAPHISTTGKVTLYGWQAVEYLRVRKHDGSIGSLKREDRGRETFVQLFNRAKKMSWLDVLKVYAAVSDDIQTNMTVADMKDNLKLIVEEQGGTAIVTNVYTNAKGSYPAKYTRMWDSDGLYYYYVPNTYTSTLKSLHSKVFTGVKYTQSSTSKSLNTKMTKAKKSLKTEKKRPNIKDVKISGLSDVVYTGQAVTPKVTVTLGGRTFREGIDYTLSYSNNVNIGSATVKVNAAGVTYTGSKSATFTINPAGTSLVSVEPLTKGFTVQWNPQDNSKLTGYQIQYSLKSTFKSGNKSKNVTGYTSSSASVTKLKKGKTYYVRVRTYAKVGKKTYYSAWSNALSVKTN